MGNLDWLTAVIPVSAVLGIIFALWLWKRVAKIQVNPKVVKPVEGEEHLLEEEQRGDEEVSWLSHPQAMGIACLGVRDVSVTVL